MKKRLLLLALATLPMFSHGQFAYLLTNNTVWIVGYSGPSGSAVVIPEAVNGVPVVAIGDRAFYYSGIRSVSVPSSVTNIGQGAFSISTSLTSISLTNGLISIGQSAFSSCYSLKSATIPNSVISVGTSAFDSCQAMTTLTIGAGVTNIGPQAFAYCGNLAAVTMGGNVVSVGSQAFVSCSKLVSLSFPSSVTNIGTLAFESCTALTAIYFKGNAPTTASSAFTGDNYLTLYYLPATSGWGPFLANRPAILWNAAISPATVGLHSNGFGFQITASSDVLVLVEASREMSNWTPVRTLTLSNGQADFTDPTSWTNQPARFYRLNTP
jgi:hypothetical protein